MEWQGRWPDPVHQSRRLSTTVTNSNKMRPKCDPKATRTSHPLGRALEHLPLVGAPHVDDVEVGLEERVDGALARVDAEARRAEDAWRIWGGFWVGRVEFGYFWAGSRFGSHFRPSVVQLAASRRRHSPVIVTLSPGLQPSTLVSKAYISSERGVSPSGTEEGSSWGGKAVGVGWCRLAVGFESSLVCSALGSSGAGKG